MNADDPKPPPDPADDERLMELAGRILDGDPVDWDDASKSSASLAEELRALGTLAHLGTAPAPGPLGDWGPLRLLDRVGEGTFGEVFRAWDMRLDREVALKLLRSDRTHPGGSRLTLNEGRLLARVRHTNVVTVFGAEEIDGRVGIWTEFIHGRTLQATIDEDGPMAALTAGAVTRNLCDALTAIHEAGVVHGDVKAQNVVQEPGGRLVLVDLGTGRERFAGQGPAAGVLSGTPLYMAPEMWRHEQPTPQSDIYSLGVLLYFLVTGTHPVPGATATEIREAHAAGRRVALRDVCPGCPAVFAAAVERALAADPSMRFESASEFAAALSYPRPHWWRYRKAIAGAATAVAASIAIAGTLWSPGRAGGRETMTRLQQPDLRFRGRPSSNGRDFPFIDNEQHLRLWNRLTNQVTTIARNGDGGVQIADWSLASPDGSHVVFAANSGKGFELRVIRRDGTGSRVVLEPGIASDAVPVDWSRNGEQILCWVNRVSGTSDLTLVPAAGGPPTVIQTVATSAAAGASLSPDGRFVAYEAFQKPGDGRLDIMVSAAAPGSIARALDADDANDWNPVWTASGDVVFASARDRRASLFLRPMTNGEPRGPLLPLVSNVNLRQTLGLSVSGELFYTTLRDTADVYVASVDLARESSIGKPEPIDADELGGHVNGNWSPDGSRFVYMDRTEGRLVIRESGIGGARRLGKSIGIDNQRPSWSPDSTEVLVRGSGTDGRAGLFRINVQTGDARVVTLFDASGASLQHEWRPDGSAIRYRHARRGIEDLDLATGERSQVVTAEAIAGTPAGFATSPDGQSLFVASELETPAGRRAVLKVWTITGRPPRGENPRILVELTAPARFPQWSADGSGVFYVHAAAEGAPFHLWLLRLADRRVQDLGALPGFTLANPRVTIHPNSHELTYMQGTFGNWLYMLEHFLK